MLNLIWLLLILISIVSALFNGTIPQVVESVTASAKFAFEVALTLVGIMAFWLGLMKIAQEAGLIQLLAKGLTPLTKRLFPDVPTEHPAMGSIIMNMAANMLGMNNAATPFGLRAMQELETLNKSPGTATNAMCTFLALNTSSLQLIPTTAIAFLAAGGASNPTEIITTSLLATCCSTCTAILIVKALEKLTVFRVNAEQINDQPLA